MGKKGTNHLQEENKLKLKLKEFFMCDGPNNALVCNKTLFQMSHIKHLKPLHHVSIIS
jgi:hypothetical protein